MPDAGQTPPAARPWRRSLRTQLSISLVVAVGVPLLLAGLAGATLLSRREALAADQALGNVAVAVARQVEAHLRAHLDVVRAVAGEAQAAGRTDPGTLGPLLARAHALHPDFRTMLATDAEGWIRVIEPPRDPQGNPVLTEPRSVLDREYFQVPMVSGRGHVSGAFRGRGIGTDPIVAVSAPLVVLGRRAGVVEGSLDLSRIPIVDGLAAPAPFDAVILDAEDKVVHATPGAGYAALQPLADAPLGLARRAAAGGAGRYERDGVGYLLASAALQEGGWHVVIQARADEVGRSTRRFLATVMVTLLGGLALALLLAVVLARRATRPLERLRHSVQAFLSGTPGEPLRVGRHAPREVADLVEGYEALQRRVGHTLSGLLPVCAWCRRIRDAEDRWHPLERYVEARFEAQVSHGICPECERAAAGREPGEPPPR